jgi:hypothetical protein
MRSRKESEEIIPPTQQLDEIFPAFLFNDMQDQVLNSIIQLEENIEKLNDFYKAHAS